MRAANTRTRMLKCFGYGAAAALLAMTPAHAGKFKVLYSFCTTDCHDGRQPSAPLLADAAGNLYGTATETAFELKNKGNGHYRFKRLVTFSSGAANNGALIMDTAGDLYGAYRNGRFYELEPGFGNRHNKWAVFDLSVSCSQQNCGSENLGGLTYAGQSSGAPYDGVSPLYRTASEGGTNGAGTVFSLTPGGGQWTQTVLYNFCSQKNCIDGSNPAGTVVLDTSGNLFGLASQGGNKFSSAGAGVAYELSQNGGVWNEAVFYAFCSLNNCSDGAYPVGDLVTDASGTLYGATFSGGAKCKPNFAGCGVVFAISAGGTRSHETVAYAFCSERLCKDGRGPDSGPILDAQGNLIGTTEFGGKAGERGGTLYELSGSSYAVLRNFCSLSDCTDGQYPLAPPLIGADGNLYGTTSAGGTGSDNGTIFKYTR